MVPPQILGEGLSSPLLQKYPCLKRYSRFLERMWDCIGSSKLYQPRPKSVVREGSVRSTMPNSAVFQSGEMATMG